MLNLGFFCRQYHQDFKRSQNYIYQTHRNLILSLGKVVEMTLCIMEGSTEMFDENVRQICADKVDELLETAWDIIFDALNAQKSELLDYSL